MTCGGDWTKTARVGLSQDDDDDGRYGCYTRTSLITGILQRHEERQRALLLGELVVRDGLNILGE
jgi:hypothetical protein